MSNNRIVYRGYEELKANLRNLPEEQRNRGGDIVMSRAQQAIAEIRTRYEQHRRSGDLAEKLKLQDLTAGGKYFVGVIIKSESKITSIFENGSEVRETKHGDNRGRVRPQNIFVPTVLKHRRAMREELKGLLREQGLKVK